MIDGPLADACSVFLPPFSASDENMRNILGRLSVDRRDRSVEVHLCALKVRTETTTSFMRTSFGSTAMSQDDPRLLENNTRVSRLGRLRSQLCLTMCGSDRGCQREITITAQALFRHGTFCRHAGKAFGRSRLEKALSFHMMTRRLSAQSPDDHLLRSPTISIQWVRLSYLQQQVGACRAKA